MSSEQQPASLRERKKTRTRETIVRVGTELFAERGVKETTIAQIAAAAEISPKTFFVYFRRKEDLLFEEQRSSTEQIRLLLETRAEGELTLDVLERALAGVAALPEPEVLRIRLLKYQVAEREPRLRARQASEWGDLIRPTFLTSFSIDLARIRHAEVDQAARILTGLTIGAFMEFANASRDSILVGRREQDVPYLTVLSAKTFDVLRDAFALLAGAESAGLGGRRRLTSV